MIKGSHFAVAFRTCAVYITLQAMPRFWASGYGLSQSHSFLPVEDRVLGERDCLKNESRTPFAARNFLLQESETSQNAFKNPTFCGDKIFTLKK